VLLATRPHKTSTRTFWGSRLACWCCGEPGHFRISCPYGREAENDWCQKRDEGHLRDIREPPWKSQWWSNNNRSGQEEWPTVGKRAGAGGKGWMSANTLKPPSCVNCHYRKGWPKVVTGLGRSQTMLRDRRHRGVRECGQARHRHRIARKTAKPTWHWGSPPDLEGTFPDTVPMVVSPKP
jgi:hypothetical protein